MLRISTTTLEAYRKVMQTEWAREADLINGLTGKFVYRSDTVFAGRAWHSVLQNFDALQEMDYHESMLGVQVEDEPTPIPQVHVRWDKFIFAKPWAEEISKIIGPGLWEVKSTRTVSTSFGPVVLVAKADHVYGNVVQDQKATFSAINEKNYEHDLQWRVYLLVHGAKKFVYNCTMFRDPVKIGDFQLCKFADFQQFVFYPYDRMEADCMIWLEAFLGWAKNRGILNYLHREQTE